jgi:hypothetical protein
MLNVEPPDSMSEHTRYNRAIIFCTKTLASSSSNCSLDSNSSLCISLFVSGTLQSSLDLSSKPIILSDEEENEGAGMIW